MVMVVPPSSFLASSIEYESAPSLTNKYASSPSFLVNTSMRLPTMNAL